MYLDRDFVISITSSSVAAGIVAGIVSLRTNARNIKIANVTRERAKWRDKVRCYAAEIHKAISGDEDELSILHSRVSLILNPLDVEDIAILRLIERPPTKESREAVLRELTDRISLLLKHDWERAKWESSSILSRWPLRPRRVKFEEFRRKTRTTRTSIRRE
jgi:hypothetical protein